MSEERVNLAQELHDGIAQDLVGLGFSIDAVIAGCQDLASKEELRKIRFAISDSIEKVRLDLNALRKPNFQNEELDVLVPDHEIQRVFSEILSNVRKHSKATQLNMQISDNGIGGAHAKEDHFGLQGINERIQKLNGDITMESNELGTRIEIQLPLGR